MTLELLLALLALVAVVALAVVVTLHMVSVRRQARELEAMRRDRETLAARVEELRQRVLAQEESAPPAHEVALIINPSKNNAEQIRRDVVAAVRHYGFGDALVLETTVEDPGTQMARDAREGRLNPGSITEDTVQRYLDEPELPDVDMFLRSSGEQRLSNFMLWQSAYAELVFLDVLWPDMDRRVLWRAVQDYVERDRRYGGAVDRAQQGRPPQI